MPWETKRWDLSNMTETALAKLDTAKRVLGLADWFPRLVTDCKTIITSTMDETGRVLLKARYEIGVRILQDYERFGSTTQEDLARELGWSQETVSKIIAFAERIRDKHEWSFEKFSNSVTKLPSWHKI